MFLLFCVGEPRATAADREVGVAAAATAEKVVGGGEFRPTRFTERWNGSERTRN